MSKSLIKKNIVKYLKKAHEGLINSSFDNDNPFFYHPLYYLRPKTNRFYHDAVSQECLEMVFEVEARNPKEWDTAEALTYLAKVVAVLKNLVECSRVHVNYDSITESGNRRKTATIRFNYVIDEYRLDARTAPRLLTEDTANRIREDLKKKRYGKPK